MQNFCKEKINDSIATSVSSTLSSINLIQQGCHFKRFKFQCITVFSRMLATMYHVASQFWNLRFTILNSTLTILIQKRNVQNNNCRKLQEKTMEIQKFSIIHTMQIKKKPFSNHNRSRWKTRYRMQSIKTPRILLEYNSYCKIHKRKWISSLTKWVF